MSEKPRSLNLPREAVERRREQVESVRDNRELSAEQTAIIDALRTHILSGEPKQFPLELSQATQSHFLQGIASLALPFEVSIVEKGGLGIIATGILDEDGMPAAGDIEVTERLIGSAISLHSHVTQGLVGLTPSPGDIELLAKRPAEQLSPARIMNKDGVLEFGLASDFAEKEEREGNPGKYSWQILNSVKFKAQSLAVQMQSGRLSEEEGIEALYDHMQSIGLIRFRKTWAEFLAD